MRVEVIAADLGGCGHYRMIWPAHAAAAEGADIVLKTDGEEMVDIPVLMKDTPTGPHVVELGDYDWPDVLVLQRPLKRMIAEAIPMIQALGVAVAIEIDDNFSAVHPQNIAYRGAQPRYSPLRNYQWLQACCDMADLVICTTEALARQYARHGRVRIIPNYVPKRYLSVVVPEYGGIIGWSGAVQTHPGDLEVTRGAVARAVAANELMFGVVGTGSGVGKRLGISDVNALGWLPLADYPNGMAQLDVTIVPLELNRFNEAKSWLKGIEAAAVGSSVVASPTVEYRRLEALGLCRIATKPRDWVAAVRDAVADVRGGRQEFAEKQRATIRAQKLIIEERVDEWLEAWSAAREARSALRG